MILQKKFDYLIYTMIGSSAGYILGLGINDFICCLFLDIKTYGYHNYIFNTSFYKAKYSNLFISTSTLAGGVIGSLFVYNNKKPLLIL